MLATIPTRLLSLLGVSAWCGLTAGLLEVATIVIKKHVFDSNQLYGMSHQFPWLIPATNLCVFLAIGVLGVLVLLTRWSRGLLLFWRFLCAITLLPIALVAGPQIYALAWLVVMLGVATWLVPLLQRHPSRFRRLVQISLPIALIIVGVLWGGPRLADRNRQARATATPAPPAGSPNILLIVMDTVAAGHLSLHGSDRPTSRTLDALAERGIRFDSAQSAAPWTLPSHAAMFTGKWMHEVGVNWLTPLNDTAPTLAGFLTSKGYATAGFVANTAYCARDSGLSRGFTTYRDYLFPGLSAFKKTALVGRVLAGIQASNSFLEDQLDLLWMRPIVQQLREWLEGDRKAAATVNRELLDWLSHRGQPDRPFFAFLNYFDAHYPYQLPEGNYYRFGGKPADTRQRAIVDQWSEMDKAALTPQDLAFSATAYDDCIADLDEQIGILVDRLRRDGVLDQTWLIIAADHGESFGEHPGIFCHGTSLYQTELHVPLVIIPPGGKGKASGQVVRESVSLRDLASTIAGLTGQAAGSPFSGPSLARFWDGSPSATGSPALAEVVPNPNAPGNRDAATGSTKPTWPLGALKDAGWSYIRREHDRREELFHLRDDAKEQRDLANDPAAQPTLDRMRTTLDRMTDGPLLPARFKP